MKRPTIAEILHLAADKFLAKNIEEYLNKDSKEKFSCYAIAKAVESLKISDSDDVYDDIDDGLIRMGLIGGLSDFREFYAEGEWGNCLTITPETQGARYAWLKFAALIAEEQGV